MRFFDMTVEKACHAFDVKEAWLRSVITPGGPIGFWSLGDKVISITSADLAALLAQEREREDAATGDG